MQLPSHQSSSHANVTSIKSTFASNRISVNFKWPQQESVLKQIRTASCLDTELEMRLKDCGILRGEVIEEKKVTRSLSGMARYCGRRIPRKQIRISFDTFLARSRPGLGNEAEIPVKKTRRRNRNNRRRKKEGDSSPDDDKEDKTVGPEDDPDCKNSFTKLVKTESASCLVRAA